VTIAACAAWMQGDEVWDTLSAADKQRVRRAATPRDMMSDQEFGAMIRRGYEAGGGAA